MARKSTIKLLLINESDNEGERLISLFRNAGRVARASRADSAESLHKMLEKDNWDLLIVDDKHPEITVEQCLEKLTKLKITLPVIVLRDQDANTALAAGASDVVASDDDQRLVHAAFRELQHLENHRKLSITQEKLIDSEERCELLMGQSQDAIAYLADGMLVNNNPLFSQQFDYSDPDDLDCAPIIDLIDPSHHEKFKSLLKTQLSSGEGSTDFNFTGIKQDGSTFAATMQLSNAVYDDEPCIQLAVRDQGSNASSSGGTQISLDRDPLTGLYSRDYFLSQLDSNNKQASSGNHRSSLLFISLDKYMNFRSTLGISQSTQLLIEVAKFLQSLSEENNVLSHFCDDSFCLLLPDVNTDKALQHATSLCQQLEQHSIEIDDQPIQCTVSIGVLLIDGQLATDPEVLIDHAFNGCEQVRTDAKSDGTGNGAAIYVPARAKKPLGDAADDEALDTIIAEAIEDNRFQLTFQPVVSLRGTTGEHYEVRTLMLDEDDQPQEAKVFLKNMRFGSANTRLDRWIILEATKKLSAKIDNSADTRLFINLTEHTLQDETLIAWLGVALKAGGIPAQAITFQFVEKDITKSLKSAEKFAKAVKAIGCNISITQFGLNDDPCKVMKQVQADFAKIAHTYAAELQNGGDTQALKALVASINENESQAIISGVENAAALAQLWQLGVDYIQGSYLAAPGAEMNYEFTDIA